MLTFFYLAILIFGVYFVSKLLVPEMRKPVLSKPRPQVAQTDDTAARIEKLEMLLAEKNKNILDLQTESKVLLAQVHNSDKIKVLLEAEIQRLREQNYIFKSELGLPSIRPKETSII